MYRSENIGARKQSPPAAGSAKSFLPRWKSCPWQRCVLWGGVFFRRTKKKSPMKKISMGYPTLDLEKISDAAVHRSGDMGRLGKIWPDPRSAGGGGRHAKSLGSKKKSSLQGLAGEVLTICKRGCFASEDWRGVNVAEHGFGTSRFAVIVVTGARRAPAPSERLRR